MVNDLSKFTMNYFNLSSVVLAKADLIIPTQDKNWDETQN